MTDSEKRVEEPVEEPAGDTYGGDELLEEIGVARVPVDHNRPFSNMTTSDVLRVIERFGVTQADLAEVRGRSESAQSQWLRQSPDRWTAKKCAEFVDAVARARMAKGLHDVRVEGVLFSDCGKLSTHRRILLNVMPLNPSLENSRQRLATMNEGWLDVLLVGASMQETLTWSDRQEVARHMLALLAANATYGRDINRQAMACMQLADSERFGGDPQEFAREVKSLMRLVPEVQQQITGSSEAES